MMLHSSIPCPDDTAGYLDIVTRTLGPVHREWALLQLEDADLRGEEIDVTDEKWSDFRGLPAWVGTKQQARALWHFNHDATESVWYPQKVERSRRAFSSDQAWEIYEEDLHWLLMESGAAVDREGRAFGVEQKTFFALEAKAWEMQQEDILEV